MGALSATQPVLQFPKLCTCCETPHSKETWARLWHKGVMVADDIAIELRICRCLTTLAVRIPMSSVCQGCNERLAVDDSDLCSCCHPIPDDQPTDYDEPHSPDAANDFPRRW